MFPLVLCPSIINSVNCFLLCHVSWCLQALEHLGEKYFYLGLERPLRGRENGEEGERDGRGCLSTFYGDQFNHRWIHKPISATFYRIIFVFLIFLFLYAVHHSAKEFLNVPICLSSLHSLHKYRSYFKIVIFISQHDTSGTGSRCCTPE